MNLPEKDKWNSPKDEVQYDAGFVAYLGLIFNPQRPVVDVGANVGKVTRFLAMRTRQKVTSFEPGPSTFRSLSANVVGLENVTLINAAVGAKHGISSFVGDGTVTAHLSDGKKGNTVMVKVVTLDETIKEPEDVGLLKIDVEGNEVGVLLGAVHLIARTKPLIAIEVIDEHLRRAGSSRADIFRLLGQYGYVKAVNKYGMTESPQNPTGASDVFFIPDEDWYTPNLKIGYDRITKKI